MGNREGVCVCVWCVYGGGGSGMKDREKEAGEGE